MARILACALAVLLAACGGGAQMNTVGEPPVIRQGESMMVFMRASQLGGLVAASVFDVSGPETKFVGLVRYGTKLAHPVKPGQYTFMVVGESADFMQATVLPGRTYYALVTPRMGVWKARFSFRPLRQHELGGAEFAGWDAATPQYVANSAEALSWAQQNAADIESKRTQYWPEWNAKPAEQRASQTLSGEDGKIVVAAAAAATAPLTAAERVETGFWESIHASNDPANFRAYLEQYPNGKFAAPARARLDALTQPKTAAAAAAAATARCAGGERVPCEGDTWTYRLTEPKRTDGPKQRNYVVKVTAASGTSVTEQFAIDQEPSGVATHKGEIALMGLGRQLLSPYLYTLGGGLPTALPRVKVGITDPACTGNYVCEAIAFVAGWEKIRVPAGTFETVKVEVRENWRPATLSGAFGSQQQGGRIMHVWYAPAAKRTVKVTSRATFGAMPPIDTDFDLELVSYNLGGAAAAAVPAQSSAPPPSGQGPKAIATGDRWTYRIADPRNGGQRGTLDVSVASASQDVLVEDVQVPGAKQRLEHRRGNYLLPVGEFTLFSPYLLAFTPSSARGPVRDIDNLDSRICGPGWTCSMRGNVIGRENVTVPAGKFSALRVEIQQSWTPPFHPYDRAETVNRTLTIWYADETKRAVRFSSRGTPVRPDTVFDLDLVNYQLK